MHGQISTKELSDKRLKLKFKWERFGAIHEELVPLFKRHYDEVALDKDIVPLDPDWNYYFGIDKLGLLQILTARSVLNGRLAGYIFNVIGTHNHYKSTRFCNTEMFWLHPTFRKGWQPVRMFKENLKGLEVFGVEIATISFKLNFENGRVGRFLARLGYEPTDIVMRRRL
jgi:hypothetical protein